MNFKESFNAIVLPVAFFAAITMLMLLIGTSYKQMNSQVESEQSINHSHKVHIEIQQLISYIKDAETNQRGYLLTQEPAFLKPFYMSSYKVNHSFRTLRILTKDNPEQQRNLDTLSILIHRKFYILVKNVHDKDHKVGGLNANMVSKLTVGREVMLKILRKADRMIALEMELLKAREEAHLAQINFSPIVFFITGLFALGTFALAFLKIKQDLRELKKKNNQLLINEKLFDYSERLAEISNWCWNVEHNILTFSKNLYRLLGCEPHEFEPTLENFIKFVHPDDRHIIEEGNQNVLAGKASIAYFRVIRKDGMLRNFKSSGKFITDAYNKQMLIGVNADITDQYIKDKELEDKVADLERSNKELSAFNHVASHDLQEPLRKIQTFISRIKDQDFDALSETTQGYFVRIQTSANRLQKLIDDLLLFSRTNKANKVFEKTNLNEILENTKAEMAETIDAKKAVIQSNVLPTLYGIPFQLQQVFDNIIGNSLKYSNPNEPVRIVITTKIVSGDSVPDHLATSAKKFYKIAIADNGIGFKQDYAENIFTLFHRLHDQSEYSGTGIGLAICKKIVENHKGYIVAESESGKGATFYIYLPV